MNEKKEGTTAKNNTQERERERFNDPFHTENGGPQHTDGTVGFGAAEEKKFAIIIFYTSFFCILVIKEYGERERGDVNMDTSHHIAMV